MREKKNLDTRFCSLVGFSAPLTTIFVTREEMESVRQKYAKSLDDGLEPLTPEKKRRALMIAVSRNGGK